MPTLIDPIGALGARDTTRRAVPPLLSPPDTDRIKDAALRGSVWAFVGLFFGLIFVLSSFLLAQWEWPFDHRLVAGVIAGTVGALIYSSIRLAVIVAVAVAMLSVLHFIVAGRAVGPLEMVALALPLGAVIGALYGRYQVRSDCFGPNCSRIYRADAKGVAGLLAGCGASLGLFALVAVTGTTPPLGLLVALLCIGTGALYLQLLPFCLRRFTDLLPPMGDGMLVGAGTATFFSLLMFVLVGGVDMEAVGRFKPLADAVLESLPEAVGGGALGAGLTGFVRGMQRAAWNDD